MMNYMVWNRASAPEYDSWEPLGNPGWNWTTLLSGMMKSENFTGIDTEDYGNIGRGTEGPIHNHIGRYRSEQLLSWVPTMESLGHVHNIESLGGGPIGAMLQSSSVNPDNYTRSYSANSYLPRAGSNLEVSVSTRVAKVNFATGSQNLTATGVTLEDGTVIEATKEVILSAGSLQSPGILELSGIGQKEVLDTVGIEQIIDLPGVGENLQGQYCPWNLKHDPRGDDSHGINTREDSTSRRCHIYGTVFQSSHPPPEASNIYIHVQCLIIVCRSHWHISHLSDEIQLRLNGYPQIQHQLRSRAAIPLARG